MMHTNFDQAIKFLNQSLDINPNYALPYYYKGTYFLKSGKIYQSQGRETESQENFDKSFKLDQKLIENYRNNVLPEFRNNNY